MGEHAKSRGAELIVAERQRQIECEGWSAEHDAEHSDGSLLKAAVAYLDVNEYMEIAQQSFCVKEQYDDQIRIRDPWPHSWDDCWDKRDRHSLIRRLVIAGALIAAEIDRVQAKAEEPKP